MAPQILTDRLLLRPWRLQDAPAALASYGDAEVARWLTPAMDRVPDEAAMGLVLQRWMADNGRMLTPAGRWAVELRSDGKHVRFARDGDYRRVPPDLRRMLKQCQNDLARMIGRTSP